MIAISTILLGVVMTFGFLWGGTGVAVFMWRGCGQYRCRWLSLLATVLCFGIAIWTTWLVIARFNGWVQ